MTGLDGRVGRGHILGFSCSGLPDKGSALVSYCLQKAPRGRCTRAECVSVCVFCVCSYAGCQIQFCSNEKTCLLARDQQMKLQSCQIANCAFFPCTTPYNLICRFYPLFLTATLPPRTELQRVLVEISLHEMEETLKTLICHQ